jgi:hypothetical protein
VCVCNENLKIHGPVYQLLDKTKTFHVLTPGTNDAASNGSGEWVALLYCFRINLCEVFTWTANVASPRHHRSLVCGWLVQIVLAGGR